MFSRNLHLQSICLLLLYQLSWLLGAVIKIRWKIFISVWMEWTPGLCHNPLEIVTIKKRSSSLKLEVEWINLWSYNVRYNQTGTAQNRGPTLALPSHPISHPRKTLAMEIFLSKKSGIRPPLPSELWTCVASRGFDIKRSLFLPIKI